MSEFDKYVGKVRYWNNRDERNGVIDREFLMDLYTKGCHPRRAAGFLKKDDKKKGEK